MTTPTATQSLQQRYALRVAARLQEGAEDLPADITERLRVARQQALLRAAAQRAPAPVAMADTQERGWWAWLGQLAGHAHFAGRRSPSAHAGSGWWTPVASALPIVLLVAGLLLIQYDHTVEQINAAAEVDMDLLADDLPPDAYSDAGFAEYLKSPEAP